MYNVYSVHFDGSIDGPCCKANMTALTAGVYARKYAKRYIGRAYPNGKGVYPWIAFFSGKVSDMKEITA